MRFETNFFMKCSTTLMKNLYWYLKDFLPSQYITQGRFIVGEKHARIETYVLPSQKNYGPHLEVPQVPNYGLSPAKQELPGG